MFIYSGNTSVADSNGGDIILRGGTALGSESAGGNVSIIGGMSKSSTGGNIVRLKNFYHFLFINDMKFKNSTYHREHLTPIRAVV